MTEQNSITFEISDRGDEESQPSKSQTSYIPVPELTSLGQPRTFGAIIVTKPFTNVTRTDYFRTYTINPSVVKTWLDSNPCHNRLAKSVTGCRIGQEDVRVIYNVNEFRVRIAPDRQPPATRGINELWWLENESGNEFHLTTDLWTRSP